MSGKIAVLVIEDDIHYGEMLGEALESFDYQVYLAYSATGGMDIIRQKKLDVIISDINMPGINGIELAKKLSEMCLDIPIILITGVADFKLIKEAMNAGVSDYLVKPIKLPELPVVIEKSIERTRHASQKLQENKAGILLETLKALMKALDAKDSYTCGHSHRVAHLAMLMADELGLDPEERYTLQLGAYLHDIGKIGMPDSILNKADSLKDTEFDTAKQHPIAGSEIIAQIKELSEVASIVRHHHERYDGTGYPDGLKGEAIPFLARIVAIIDCYEALVSDRAYRKGVDRGKALEIIRQNAGKQFDPELVKVFLKVMEQEFSGNGAMKPEETVLLKRTAS